jgi:transposase
MRRRYDKDFKISIVAELENGKPPSQIALEYGIHPSLPALWRDDLAESLEKAPEGSDSRCRHKARIEELERLLDQLRAENELLRKELRHGAKDKSDAKDRYTITPDDLSGEGRLSISESCQILRISRSTYYKQRKQAEPMKTDDGRSMQL